jgi:glucose-6-phosphate 1-dehydrogenase
VLPDISTPTEPQDILIYGATGDLASHRLWPALYNLHYDDLLPTRGVLIGVALDQLSREQFVDRIAGVVRGSSTTHWDARRFRSFARRLRYHAIDETLRESLLAECKQPKRIAYLSTPPSAFEPVLRQLKDFGLTDGLVVVIEKPFGHDLISAQYLNSVLHNTVPESSIFRVDHYLG